MRHGLLTAVAVLALGIPAGQAWAGGVVIDFRELGMVSEEAANPGESLDGAAHQTRPFSEVLGRQPPRNSGGGTVDPGTTDKESGQEVKLSKAERQRQIELQQLILAGVVTPEEAMSGCGASAAPGPAGLAPLALALAAILRHRRRA